MLEESSAKSIGPAMIARQSACKIPMRKAALISVNLLNVRPPAKNARQPASSILAHQAARRSAKTCNANPVVTALLNAKRLLLIQHARISVRTLSASPVTIAQWTASLTRRAKTAQQCAQISIAMSAISSPKTAQQPARTTRTILTNAVLSARMFLKNA